MADIYIENSEFSSKNRKNIFYAILSITAIGLMLRLAFLQIVEGKLLRDASESQAVKQVIVEPFRGNMYDRNGILIVHNEPSFTVTVTKYDFNEESIALLSSIMQIDTTALRKILKSYEKESKFIPIKIFKDVDFEKIALLEEYSDILSGVEVIVESKRLYDFDGHLAHILGYSREVSKKQIEKKKYYRPGDVVGVNGLELTYDDMLRGKQGIQFVSVNKFGQKVGFDNGRNDIESSNGFDLFLTIDIKLQEVAEKLLKGRRGAIVAIDPNNGEVLALASKPDYDPRMFAGKISTNDYRDLINNESKPLLNRSIMSQYPPGSTWKMLVALACLQEGLISQNYTTNCPGFFNYGGRVFKCHGAHGTTDIKKAIQGSCNTFFYELGLKLGFDNFEKYGNLFGMGKKTFIDLPGENSGLMPSLDWLTKKLGPDAAKARGRLVNYGIGQGEILTTPLQMAVYAATLANNGTYYQPHLVNFVHNNINGKVEPLDFDQRELPIDKKYFDIIKEGMWRVVNTGGGTAGSARIGGVDVCGKTGTAQNPHGRDHAWFIGFAPKKDPKIAFCIFVENAGFGGSVSAPIARELLFNYFFPDSVRYSRIDSLSISLPDSSNDSEIPD